MAVVIETTVGDITVDLFIEERPLSKYSIAKFLSPIDGVMEIFVAFSSLFGPSVKGDV